LSHSFTVIPRKTANNQTTRFRFNVLPEICNPISENEAPTATPKRYSEGRTTNKRLQSVVWPCAKLDREKHGARGATETSLISINEAFPLPERTGSDMKKSLANLWSRRKIAKKAHVGRGHETRLGMSIKRKVSYESFAFS
jgi:hypothetical protein